MVNVRDEFALIRMWTNRLGGRTGDRLTVGIGDDAAVFAVSAGMEVVACCDAMIETVHFLRETMRPADIGYKALISNISDIAAMGGIPRFALVTIGVSPRWTAEECAAIYEGIGEAAERYDVCVIGGDTVSTPDALHLSVTLLGEVEKGQALLRSAAKPGDVVFVTGPLGGAAAGLHVLQAAEGGGNGASDKWASLIAAHQRPAAQVEAGRLMVKHGRLGALNDISDGLASELWEIAEASGISITVNSRDIPMLPELVAYGEAVGIAPLRWVLYGGEDYQLVGTVPQEEADSLQRLFAQAGVPLFLIGAVSAGPPEVTLIDGNGQRVRLEKRGYNHFAREKSG